MGRGKFSEWLTKEGLLKLEAWARDGLTDEQIAHNMGIVRQTLSEWRGRFPDIDDALKRSKEIADIQVENKLFKRAIGYTCIETTEEPVLDKATGETKLVVTKRVTKEVPPDVTAQIFWLKNRKPKEWRDKRDLEHSGEVKNPFAGLSTEQLIKLAGDEK